MISDLSDNGTPDDDPVGELGHVCRIFRSRNTESHCNRRLGAASDGFDIPVDLPQVREFRAGNACQ